MVTTTIISLTTFCYLTIGIGILTNGSLLVFFVRSKRLRSLPANKLICSLLFSDFLIEISFAVTIPITDASTAHKVAFLLRVVAMTLTLLNLCTIWIERLVALKMTFSHHRIIDNKTVTKTLIACWGIGCSLAVASTVMFCFQMELTTYKKWRYVTSIMTVVGFCVLIAANAIILCEARNHAKKIRKQSLRNRQSRTLAWQLKSTYLCTSMVTAFLIFWLPYLIANVGVLLHGVTFTQRWFSLFSALMILCNTVAHPCLYVLLNRETRKFLSRRWQRSRTNQATKRSLEGQRSLEIHRKLEGQKSVSSIVTISMRPI